MVENEDAAGAGHLLEEGLGLRVVDAADLVVVPEIAHRAAVLGQRETLHVERQLAGDRAQIVDRHLVRFERHVRRRVGVGPVIGVIARALGGGAEIVQLALDIGQAVGLVMLRPPLVTGRCLRDQGSG